MSSSLSASSSQGTNEGANQSTVYASATVTITAGYFQGLQSYGYINIGGEVQTIVGPTYLAALSDPHVAPESWTFTASRTFQHDTNGYRGNVDVSASFVVDGASFHDSSAGGGTQGAIDYNRRPAGMSSVSAVANVDKSVVVSFSGGGSPGGSPALSSTYHVSISKNGGAFTGDYTGTSSPITIPSSAISPGSNHVFRVYATNQSADGAGASADSASIFVTAGGRIYNGTAWVPTVTARIYNGTAWVPIATARIYDGTTWRNMT